jgi:hypothetical protein
VPVPPRPRRRSTRSLPVTKDDLEHALGIHSEGIERRVGENIERRLALQSEDIERRLVLQSEDIEHRFERALGVHIEQLQGHLRVVLEKVQDCATKTELRELSDRVDARFEGIDARFDGIDARFDGIDTRLGGIDIQLRGLRDEVARKADAASFTGYR